MSNIIPQTSFKIVNVNNKTSSVKYPSSRHSNYNETYRANILEQFRIILNVPNNLLLCWEQHNEKGEVLSE
jgi:hypothetical protein